jgi:hypothetical protein
MVSAAIAWVRAARTELTPDRVVQAVRLGARDIEKPGWDPLTGFGVLNVGNSLNLPADKLPIQDPLEPNDNIVWVDGTAFGKPATAIWKGGTAARVNALLDKQEDPVDVYRIVIPGGRTAKISVIPRFGDPSVEVFTASAISVNDETRRVAYGHRSGVKKTERVSVRNGGKTAKISVIPRFGDPQVEVFTSSAISINDEDRRVAYAHRSGAKKTERVSVRNGGKSKHSYYVAIRPQGNSRYQERQYTLRVSG